MDNTIVMWIIVALVVVLAVAAVAWVSMNRRKEHHRVEAETIRDDAAERSMKVSEQEALAEETAAKARVAEAEADAKAAEAARLESRAQARGSEAAASRSEVEDDLKRADKIDPDTESEKPPE
ncbi:hypothetical protein [Rhodococcus daqingensis]|uniref:Uncharacterized protein n=1 Tax=Rhodococcus daqingensis TaxID=2479363 RepID=A0ABW2S1B3_9NOCA